VLYSKNAQWRSQASIQWTRLQFLFWYESYIDDELAALELSRNARALDMVVSAGTTILPYSCTEWLRVRSDFPLGLLPTKYMYIEAPDVTIGKGNSIEAIVIELTKRPSWMPIILMSIFPERLSSTDFYFMIGTQGTTHFVKSDDRIQSIKNGYGSVVWNYTATLQDKLLQGWKRIYNQCFVGYLPPCS